MQLKHRHISRVKRNMHGTETSNHLDNKHPESELMDAYVDLVNQKISLLEQHGPCRVLVSNGVKLETPEVIPVNSSRRKW